MDEILKMAITQGIWCALFVALFIWTLKSNEKRETESGKRELNYQNVINTLSADIRDRLDDIADELKRR